MSNEETSDTHKTHKSTNKLVLLALGALGVVFGDIGTSPLYAVRELFYGHNASRFTSTDVIGVISIVIWSLTLIVSVKYIIFVLRADNEGQGGVFALYGLIDKLKKKSNAWILLLLTFAAGLLLGDGIITPAISVVSAVEGLGVATKSFEPFIIPITVGILAGLFSIQSKGTAKIGRLFGPVMALWFTVIALLGITYIFQFPGILNAFNPYNAMHYFLTHSPQKIFTILGSVMLVVTGGEALYADMGHFGRSPIRLSWFSIAYPALIMNYLGQGAYLLSGQIPVGNNIFYSMAPAWGLYPLVILATCATVIASQALISGAFSLASQAISLGLIPFLDEEHTNSEHEGQIYIPFINWALFAGSVLLVLIFKSSDNLASMYGMAVSGDMLITTFSMIIIAHSIWKWKPLSIIGTFVLLGFIDGMFVFSNSLKFLQGGYIPFGIGIAFLYVSKTWQWGRSIVRKTYQAHPKHTIKDLVTMKSKQHSIIDVTRIILTPEPIINLSNNIPALMQVYLDRYRSLPKHLIFVTVKIVEYPVVKQRFQVRKLFENESTGTITAVTIHFGYMEDPYVEKVLEDLAAHHEITINEDHKKWLILVLHERLHISKKMKILRRIQFELYKLMNNNAVTADVYFGLGYKQPLTVEVLPVFVK